MATVSVIIPCFNLGCYVYDAVESVRRQEVANIETIIVDDGSTDGDTREVLERLRHEGVTIIRTLNRGVSAARNIGIAHASTEYVLPLDADDLIHPLYLSRALETFGNDPEAGVVYCDAEFCGARAGSWELPAYSPELLLLQNLIFSSAVFRKADWMKVGGYCESMRAGWEDWDFWLSMAEAGAKVVKIPEVLFFYRIRAESRDRSLSLSTKMILYLKMIANHRNLYWRHRRFLWGRLIDAVSR